MYRYIDEEKLLALIMRQGGADTAQTLDVQERVAAWLRRQPTQPDLIGASRVAKILGILPPNVSKLRERGVLPDPIHIDGSVDVWHRADIEKIGVGVRRDRERRLVRRTEREG